MKPFITVQIQVFAMSLLMASPVMAEKLANLSSRYCLDTNGKAANGGAVRMWNCATHPNQTWTVEQVDSAFYRLINHSSKFCLDTDGSKTNGALVRMWKCANHPNQLWEIQHLPENRYRLMNKASGFCLDTDGKAINGGVVRMWNCTIHPNQSWFMQSPYTTLRSGEFPRVPIVPTGSYSHTCENIKMENERLTAECKTRDGNRLTTSLKNPKECLGDIGNIDGNLTCARGEKLPPNGSYRETCRAIVVKGESITAECKKIDSTWVSTSLNDLKCIGDISNNNGVLQCNNPPSGSGAPAPVCSVSVLITLSRCYDSWGQPSWVINPNSISQMGCGSDTTVAQNYAVYSLAQNGFYLSESPMADRCTYTTQTYSGCYCQ